MTATDDLFTLPCMDKGKVHINYNYISFLNLEYLYWKTNKTPRQSLWRQEWLFEGLSLV